MNITITPFIDNPDAQNDRFSTDQNKVSAPLDLLGNDTDPEQHSLSVIAIAGTPLTGGAQDIIVDHGTVHVTNSGQITFTPNRDYHGPTSFQYTISDGHGGTDTATVKGTINAPPFITPLEPTQPEGQTHITGSQISTQGGTVGSHQFSGNNDNAHWSIVPIGNPGQGSGSATGLFGTAHIDQTGRVWYDLQPQSQLQQLLKPGAGTGTVHLDPNQIQGHNPNRDLVHPKTSITLQTNPCTDVFAIYKNGHLVGFWVASWDENISAYKHDNGHDWRFSGGISDFKSWDLPRDAYPSYHDASTQGTTRMGQVHQRDAETSDFSDELNAQIAALEAAGIHLTEKAEVKEFLGTTILIVHTDHGDLVQAITNYADASPLRTIDPSGLNEEAQKALAETGYLSTSSGHEANNNSEIKQEPLPADDATRELLDGLQNLGLMDSSNQKETSQRTQEDGSLITTLTNHTKHGDIVQTITAAGNGEQLILKVDTSGLDTETQQALHDSLKASQETATSQSKLPDGQEGSEEGKAGSVTIDGAALSDAIQEIQKLDPAALAAMHSGRNPDETAGPADASIPTPLDANEVQVSSSNDVFSEEIKIKRGEPAETGMPEGGQDLISGGELPGDTQQDDNLFNI